MKNKTVYLKSFGCQMNDADSEQLLGLLSLSGYHSIDSPEEADLILLNTCAIREKAEQKVFSDLGRLKFLKNKNPRLKIGVAGCVAQSMGKKILSREPSVDFVLGTQSMHDLPELLIQADLGNKRTSLAQMEDSGFVRTETIHSSPVQAYIPIIYGCENFCSYCVVPKVRGPERSRPVEVILQEISELAEKGYKETILLGQNVNSYGKKSNINSSFSELLRLVHQVRGIERIRFITSHPRDLSLELMETMAELPKVCEALHLPVQSGSNRILEAMNRGYTCEEYLYKLESLRDQIPDIVVTTDIIVGFPGESGDDFQETLSLIRKASFDQLYGFRFSPRPGTPAENLAGPVDESIAAERLEQVFELQREISQFKNNQFLDKELEVLVEGPGKKDPTRLRGRARSGKIVHFTANKELTGKLVRVKIEKALPNCLLGEFIESDRI